MSLVQSSALTADDYERAADAYARSLPLEHYMEAIAQSTQREIIVESLALLRTRRADLQYFNELLVQYLHGGRLRQVVPDNMVVLATAPPLSRTNFAVEREPAAPFFVLEYVSAHSQRKDYQDSFRKYEQELKVPYCLFFYPEKQDLRVYRHDGERYVRLEPDGSGRVAIPELDLQIGVHRNWVRFWHDGQLLELPGELQERMDEQQARLDEQQARLAEQQARLDEQQARLAEQQTRLTEQQSRLAGQSTQINDLQGELRRVADGLRRRVEQRASQKGRQDILQQLAATAETSPSLEQLDRWLTELD